MRALVLLTLAAVVHAHGDHDAPVNPSASYAELHMAQEHHMDNFDIQSMFHLHDLNQDGVLDQNELESIYGVHHEKLKKAGVSVEVHTEKAREIVSTVLKKLDTNGDGVLTMREFVAGGVAGLPNFEGVEHLGHHYDAEGEYFLHHEEQFHSTPETQRDADYIHPEDIAHFMNHAKLEDEEDDKVRAYQGLPAEDGSDPLLVVQGTPETPATPGAGSPTSEETKRQERADYARAQALKFGKSSQEARRRGEWGSGATGGFARPRDMADRLRKDVPYKFKVKKSSWFGEF